MYAESFAKEDFWLSSYAKYLISLYRLGGEANARKLIDYMAQNYGTSHSSFYSITPVLEKKGYIIVIEEGRSKKVKLTEEGRKIAEQLAKLSQML